MFKNYKKRFEKIKHYLSEFDKMNARYNNVTASIISIIFIIFVSLVVVIGNSAYKNGTLKEFPTILPIYITLFCISVASLIILTILRKKELNETKISETFAFFQIVACIVLMLISGHVEVPDIGIKNINVIILIMFAVLFFLKFKLRYILLIETTTTIAVVVLLFIEKNQISNFMPSLINIVAAGILSSLCAFLYWQSRIENYVMSHDFKKLATSDSLTKVFNRRGFDAFFSNSWEEAIRDKTQIVIFIIDIDYFKNFNDSYGHLKGDACLTSVAAALTKSIRKNDIIARYGGEEFAIILTRANAEDAKIIAERIFNNIKHCEINHENSPVAQTLTVSVGCMIANPHKDNISQLEFLTLADDALYMAKERGRNRLVFHPRVRFEK